MLTRPPAALTALLALTALAGSLSGCGGDSHASGGSGESSQASGPACTYQPTGTAARKVDPPPAHAAVSGKVPATITTSAGDVAMTLDADSAPCTVGSFVSLAKQGYFDHTSCHRLTTQGIYVLQCGDPTGTGAGGPGYSFGDELSGDEKYGEATVAMANAGPDTNGSQFFLVYGDSPLPPAYTVFGTLSPAGLKTVQAVGRKGTADGGPDGAPKQKVEISSVSVG